MTSVFISYSRKDSEFARRLHDCLKEQGWEIWIDWKNIEPTVDWWKEIERGIETAGVFLFLISPDSAASKICRQEIEHAVRNNKRLIPLEVRGGVSGDQIPAELGHINWISFRESDNFDQALLKLTTAVQTDYNWVQTHRELQIKALEWDRSQRDKSFLLQGTELQAAEFQLDSNSTKKPHPTDLQRDYVLKSRQAADRQTRIRNSIAIVVVIVVAILGMFGWVQAGRATNNEATAISNEGTARAESTRANNNALTADANARTAEAASTRAVEQKQEAEEQAKIARAGELAAQSIEMQTRNLQVSILLGIESFNLADLAQSRRALLQAVNFSPLIQFTTLPDDAGKIMALSPDGSTIAVAGENHSIILWDIKARRSLGKKLVGHKGEISAVTFSPAGTRLASSGCTQPEQATGCPESEIFIWDIKSADPIRQSLGSRPGLVSKLIFTPQESILASINGTTVDTYPWPNTITLWNLLENEQFGQTIAPGLSVLDMAISPDGNTAALYTFSSPVTLWDMKTQNLMEELTIDADGLDGVVFSRDGGKIVTNDWNEESSFAVWDMATHQEHRPNIKYFNYDGAADKIALSPDGRILASATLIASSNAGANISEITLWNLDTMEPVGWPLSGHTTKISDMVFSTDGKTLISAGEDNTIILWNIPGALDTSYATLQPLSQYFFQSEDHFYSETTQIAFSQDGRKLASSFLNKITVWDVGSRVPDKQVMDGQNFTFRKDGTVMVQSDAPPFWGDTGGIEITSLVPSPDGSLIATGMADGKVVIWDATMHTKLKTLETGQSETGDTGTISDLAFSHDGKILAAQYGTNSIVVWNMEKQDHIGQAFNGFTFALSADSKTLATTVLPSVGKSSSANGIILWDVAAHQPIGQLFDPYIDSQAIIEDLAFSPDGKTLATIRSGSGSIIFWDLDPKSWLEKACQRVGRNLTLVEWQQYFPQDQYRKTCDQWQLGAAIAPAPKTTP